MSSQAATLQCPTCGAPALSDATYCAYCKARLATAACPSCFGMVFAGTKFCPHCGAHADRVASVAAEGDAAKKCPRCRVDLKAVSIGGVPVHECPDCSGLWLGADTFQRVSTEREAQAAVLVGAGGTAEPAHAAPEARVRYVPCPECGKVMNRVNFARVSGVVVDVCKGHGTWFDADELRRVVEFIRGGGLEVAREKERQALEEERRRLASAQSSGAYGAGMAGMIAPEQAAHPLPGQTAVNAALAGLFEGLISAFFD